MSKSRPDKCEHSHEGACMVHVTGKGKEKRPYPCKGFNRECPKKARKGKGNK